MEYLIVNGELYHYGLKGMKWGVRRWQNDDGTFNSAGKARYFGDGAGENYHKLGKSSNKKKEVRSAGGNLHRALAKNYEINEHHYTKTGNKMMASANRIAKNAQLKKAESLDKAKAEKIAKRNTPEEKAKRAERAKKVAIAGAAVAAAGLAAYGGYKLYSKDKARKSLLADAKMRQAKVWWEKYYANG